VRRVHGQAGKPASQDAGFIPVLLSNRGFFESFCVYFLIFM
jgi:hypothetical protein